MLKTNVSCIAVEIAHPVMGSVVGYYENTVFNGGQKEGLSKLHAATEHINAKLALFSTGKSCSPLTIYKDEHTPVIIPMQFLVQSIITLELR